MDQLHLIWASTFEPALRQGGYQGAHFNLLQAMRARLAHIAMVAPLHAPDDRLAMLHSRLLTLVTGRRLLWPYSNHRLHAFAKAFIRRTHGLHADITLFFGDSAHLRTTPTMPYACFFDSAYVPYLEYYETHRRYAATELARLASLEQRWLAGAHRVFTTSDFARRAILDRYQLAPARIVPVGIGPNFTPTTLAPAPAHTPATPPSICFIATDFARKGGPLAIEAVGLARRQLPGLTLHVVGAPPPPTLMRDYVRAHGWIDTSSAAGAAAFSRILSTADLYLLLSSADLTPNSICEAFAHRVPVMAFATGGIPEMVSDGLTGWLLPPGASAAAVADRLVAALHNRPARDACAAAAHHAFESTWNWQAVVDHMLPHLQAVPRRATP